MSDAHTPPDGPNLDRTADASDASGATPSGSDASAQEAEGTDDELATAREKYLRLLAEFDNYKKRVQRDQSDYAKFAAEKVLKDLLPVVDNLERAVAHARSVHADAPIVEGMELIVRQFHDALQKSGCEPIHAVGKAFDPAYHQALAQTETKEHDADMVLDEAQRGYLLHGRILRPSLVTVSRRPQGD